MVLKGTDLEMEDDRPDEAEGELGVPVDDVLGPDVHQFDLPKRKPFNLVQKKPQFKTGQARPLPIPSSQILLLMHYPIEHCGHCD